MNDEEDVAKTRDERPSSRREPPRLDHADTLPAVEVRPSSGILDASRRYTLGAEIARGGMGRVVEATDTLLGRQVALKAALADEPDAVRRFARETQVTARLEHPSIIPVYDAGRTTDGLPYYVMRKVAGRPLEALIHERRTIDERLGLLPNVLAAVEAVAHAHGRGVLHRDLKPGNILVGELGETVVIDWGLAKVIDDVDDAPVAEDPNAGLDAELKTRAGQVVGTPGFMAPEQLHGEPATRACDVYALGSLLYCMLAGEPPHAARSSDEMIALALRGPPLPIDEVISGVPGELVTILERAMAYDTSARYLDAGA
ncbi:MAG: serine/threonine protein kinase, partial [Deltaproteobacteria bacterium]|nr:serine/threonine protein kinase [Deltaproteobacteria bacterium]